MISYRGIYVDIVVGAQFNVFHLAALSCRIDIMRLLLKYSPNQDTVNIKDNQGVTALGHAWAIGYEHMIKLLLDHGATTDFDHITDTNVAITYKNQDSEMVLL